MFRGSKRQKLLKDLKSEVLHAVWNHNRFTQDPPRDIRYLDHKVIGDSVFTVAISRVFKIEMDQDAKFPALDSQSLTNLKAMQWMRLALSCEQSEFPKIYESPPLKNEDFRQFVGELRRDKDRIYQMHMERLRSKEAEKVVMSRAVEARVDIRSELNGRSLLEWMKYHGSDPELWHYLVEWLDPGLSDGEDVFCWIVFQPDCDAGTAAEIFHLLNPYDHLEPEFSAINKKIVLALQHVVNRWHSGSFKTFNYPFKDALAIMETEESHRSFEKNAMEKHGFVNFQAPSTLFTLRPSGREPNPKYHYSSH